MKDFDYKPLIILCTLLLIFIGSVTAQEEPDLSMLAPYQLKNFGRNAERSGDVYTAIDYYEAYRKQKPGNAKNLYNLAKLYHNARNYEQASELYKKVYDKSPKKYILAQFYYAQTLKSMGQYDQAIEEFENFRRAYRGAKDYNTFRKLCRAETEGCEKAKSLLDDPLKITIEDLNTTINSRHVDFAPIPVSDSTFIYSSLVVDSTKFFSVDDPSSIPVRQLYRAHKEENDWIGGEKLPGPFNIEGVETGNGAFSRDGKRFYFTRCEKNWQNKAICAIYVSHLEKGKWSDPVKLPPIVNDPNYTSTQPTIGTTAKYNREVIYFVSDRPDGRGGLDLWYTIWKQEKNEYTEPRNLGFKVNTPGDEMTPFFDHSSRTLYFSSTGQPGLGGFDIFHTTGQLRKWTTAVNAGYPLNSSYDDLYFTISSSREDGFIVSNRPGGLTYRGKTCCDDIYYYRWKEFVELAVTGKIYPAVKGTFNWTKDQDQLRVGNNDSVKPLEGAILALYMIDDETGEPIFIDRDTTGADGIYYFNLLPDKNYTFEMEGFQYFNEEIHLSTEMITFSYTIDMPPIWVNILPKEPIELENIYYEFDKANLTDKAKESIDTTLLAMMNEIPNIIVEVGSHTDGLGGTDYNKNLSQERANNVIAYLISKGIEPSRLVAKGYGDEKPIAPNKNPDGSDNPEGREKNRRTEFRIIGTMSTVQGDPDEEY